MMRRDTFAIVTLGATMMSAFVASAQLPQANPTPATGIPPVAAQPTPDPTLPSAVPPTGAVPPAMPGTPGDPNLQSAVPGAGPLPGATPAMPGATPATLPGGLPALPAMPGMAAPGAMPGMTAPGAAVPTPPPLGDMNLETADTTTADTTATVGGAAAPSQLYSFLFIDEPDYGVVRQRFQSDVAEQLKEAEIQRLITVRRQGQQPGGGVMIPGVTPGFASGFPGDPATMGGAPGMGGYPGAVDPMMMGDPTFGGGLGAGGGLNNESAIRAAAEWDFYYDQLEMYDTYIREKLIPDAENLPTLEYTAANALQERQDLFESFQEAAIEQSNVDYNQNKEFYERLQLREDRRREYMEWLLLKEREVADWAEVWARRVFATRWADGEEVRVDDWYYGTDFNSAQPVLVQIDDREYIISRQPARSLEDGQLNVISSNMTPYDIIDNNGYLKNPVMETLRGTLIVPPAGPVYTTDSTTGTIEIVGETTTE